MIWNCKIASSIPVPESCGLFLKKNLAQNFWKCRESRYVKNIQTNEYVKTNTHIWTHKPVKGGNESALYTAYIPTIYCLLGPYIIPTTYYHNQNNPLRNGWSGNPPMLDTPTPLSTGDLIEGFTVTVLFLTSYVHQQLLPQRNWPDYYVNHYLSYFCQFYANKLDTHVDIRYYRSNIHPTYGLHLTSGQNQIIYFEKTKHETETPQLPGDFKDFWGSKNRLFSRKKPMEHFQGLIPELHPYAAPHLRRMYGIFTYPIRIIGPSKPGGVWPCINRRVLLDLLNNHQLWVIPWFLGYICSLKMYGTWRVHVM